MTKVIDRLEIPSITSQAQNNYTKHDFSCEKGLAYYIVSSTSTAHERIDMKAVVSLDIINTSLR